MKQITLLIAIICTQFVFSQSQMYDVCPIKVGAKAPNSTLVNDKNEQVSLEKVIANKPTVIIFYRGAWCGYCTKHLAELNESKDEIENLGFQIIGVSVDKFEKLAESKTENKNEISVYSDATLETTSAFGLNWQLDDALYQKYKNEYKLDLEEWSGEVHHSLPVPAIFVIKDNTVEFQYVNPNYKSRLKPETLIALLKTI